MSAESMCERMSQVLELAFADKGAEAPTQSKRQSWRKVNRRSPKKAKVLNYVHILRVSFVFGAV